MSYRHIKHFSFACLDLFAVIFKVNGETDLVTTLKLDKV